MANDIPAPRYVRGLLSTLDSSPNRLQQLYCLYKSVRWWVEYRSDGDGSSTVPLSVLAHWARLDRDTTADRLEQLEAWGLILIDRAAPSRAVPPRQRYRLGDMTSLRSGVQAWCQAEGIGAGMGDVILGKAGLGESVSVSFEDE